MSVVHAAGKRGTDRGLPNMNSSETILEEKFVSLPRGMRFISARQAKAARAVLGLSVASLAEECGVSESSIRRIEAGADVAIKVDLILKLQAFFEVRGFTFLWDGKEDGLRWPM